MKASFRVLFVLLALLLAVHAAGALSCGGISIDARDVSLDEGTSRDFTFYIENDSDFDFEVHELRVIDVTARFDSFVVDYPSVVAENDREAFTIRIEADEVTSQFEDLAYIKAMGEFETGMPCGYADIGYEYFNVAIENEGSSSTSCNDIEIDVSDVYLDEEESILKHFSIENNSDNAFVVEEVQVIESSTYFDAFEDSHDWLIPEGSEGALDIYIEAYEVSYDRSGEVDVRVRGYFEGGRTCSFSNIGTESFEVHIDDDYDSGDEDEDEDETEAGECSGIDLVTNVVRVERNQTVNESFILANNEDERFYVDFVEAYDSSNDIRTELVSFDRTVNSGGYGLINFKVKAYENAGIGKKRGYIRIRGHFQGESTCSIQGIGSKSFEIEVTETGYYTERPVVVIPSPVNGSCNGVIVSVESEKVVENAAVIPVKIKNDLDWRVEIELSGQGISVNPHRISVPEHSFVNETVSITSTTGFGETFLYYKIDAGNCIAEKRTRIVNTGAGKKSLGDSIGMKAAVNATAASYEVEIELENKTGETIKGTLDFDVPSNWTVSGEKEVELLGNQTKTVKFELRPQAALASNLLSEASFTVGSEEIKRSIVFKAQTGSEALATGLFALGANLAIVGLVVVIAILLILILTQEPEKGSVIP